MICTKFFLNLESLLEDNIEQLTLLNLLENILALLTFEPRYFPTDSTMLVARYCPPGVIPDSRRILCISYSFCQSSPFWKYFTSVFISGICTAHVPCFDHSCSQKSYF